MANWKEIVIGPGAQWDDVEDRQNYTATRVYHDQGSTSAALPAFDSSLGDGTPRFLANIRKVKIGGHFDKNLAILSYAPRTGDEDNQSIAFNDLKKQFQIGGEALSIDGQNSYFWKTDADPVAQRVFKRIQTGTVTWQETVSNLDMSSTGGPVAKMIQHAGKVNRGTFQGQSSGTWLYLGANGDERRSQTGSRFWLIEHAMAYRKIPNSQVAGNGFLIGTNEWGWIKQWRDDAGQWDVASGAQGFDINQTVYENVSFSNIFSTSNVV